MRRSSRTLLFTLLAVCGVLALEHVMSAVQSQPAPAGPANKLIVYGDTAMFTPPGTPENCILRSRFKRGDPVGWRMFVADPQTGNREESAQLVVHVNFAGKMQDIPMRYRATVRAQRRIQAVRGPGLSADHRRVENSEFGIRNFECAHEFLIPNSSFSIQRLPPRSFPWRHVEARFPHRLTLATKAPNPHRRKVPPLG